MSPESSKFIPVESLIAQERSKTQGRLPQGFLGSIARVDLLESYPKIIEWAREFSNIDPASERTKPIEGKIEELQLRVDVENLVDALVNNFFQQMFDDSSLEIFPRGYEGYQIAMSEDEFYSGPSSSSSVGSMAIHSIGPRSSEQELTDGLNDILLPYITRGVITPVDRVEVVNEIKGIYGKRKGVGFTIFLSIPA